MFLANRCRGAPSFAERGDAGVAVAGRDGSRGDGSGRLGGGPGDAPRVLLCAQRHASGSFHPKGVGKDFEPRRFSRRWRRIAISSPYSQA
jgi:hypothetical protein